MRYCLHITHTHVETDNRILKEMDAIFPVAQTHGHGVAALGLNLHARDNTQKASAAHLTINSIQPLAGRLPRALKLVRHVAIGFETLFWFLILSFRFRPASVHAHDALFLPIAWLISLIHRAPLVYDAHELETNRNGFSKTTSRVMGVIERTCWRRIRLFISVSQAINTWYIDTYGAKENIVILNSPVVETDQQQSASGKQKPTILRDRFDIDPDRPVFVYLGILTRGRGLDPALAAFAQLAGEADLICIGWGDYEARIKEAAARNSNIHLHEPVPHDQVVGLVAEADFGLCLLEEVSLSDYLALPNKLFEYAFAGLPVLASEFPELHRVITDHDLGITCNPEANSIVEGIRALLARKQNFRFENLHVLSWQAQSDRLEKAYKNLLD